MLQDEEDQEILSPDSESEISKADDLDYVPQGQSGVVGVNPVLLDEEGSFDGIEDLSDESSEEETQTQSNRLSKNVIHQGAGQRACRATYEEVLGGQASPSKPYYRGNGKMWDKKQNTVNTQPQVYIRQSGQSKRKRICPAAKDRQVSSWCSVSGLCAKSTNL
ncbi:hypothetical protein G5714_005641 [Onychostoma macrolepis]|uniref:Uncharacterized protein n=1 Tax=Onychostoma macrolepis TaxID=369639 RepID=A0A7J6D1L4_9TELE|nr:hypothetical protein G5714_005641 [Onychostoma macrolepis]